MRRETKENREVIIGKGTSKSERENEGILTKETRTSGGEGSCEVEGGKEVVDAETEKEGTLFWEKRPDKSREIKRRRIVNSHTRFIQSVSYTHLDVYKRQVQ